MNKAFFVVFTWVALQFETAIYKNIQCTACTRDATKASSREIINNYVRIDQDEEEAIAAVVGIRECIVQE